MIKKCDEKVNLSKIIDKSIESYVTIKSLCEEKYTKESIRNFIEKIAVWYELVYPSIKMSDYKKMDAQGNYDIWPKEFISTDLFLNNLSSSERYLLEEVEFPKSSLIGSVTITPWHMQNEYTMIQFDCQGIVEDCESTQDFIDIETIKKKVVGKSTLEAYEILHEFFPHKELEELREKMYKYKCQEQARVLLLDCITYRIIERGKSYDGVDRAMMFAQEFNGNIDIPVIYSGDRFFFGLKELLNKYLTLGGNSNTIIYMNYFMGKDDEEILVISVKEVIEELTKIGIITEQEINLYQNLTHVLDQKLKLQLKS